MPRFDLFIDEDKRNRKIGVLAVSNVVGLNQTLQNVRFRYRYGKREMKWNGLDKFRMPVVVSWLWAASRSRRLLFHILDWPSSSSKGDVLLDFLPKFMSDNRTDRVGTYFDSVVFLDFDNEDKNERLNQRLVNDVKVLRCYSLDSRGSNCLQLADLLLGVTVRERTTDYDTSRSVAADWEDIDEALRERRNLSVPEFAKSECKRYLTAYYQTLPRIGL